MKQPLLSASTAVALSPSIVMGLYMGRLISERFYLATVLQAATAVTITLILIVITHNSLKKYRFSQTWPALLLLIYIFYPQPNPEGALWVALLTGVTWLLSWHLPYPHLSKDRQATAVAIICGFLYLILYIATLAPDILPADNGEFQTVAATLGVAHPPGFSLYTMLAHLMTRLPFAATAAYKVNLLSAFTSAATLTLIYITTFRLTRRHSAAITAVVALGSATTFWAQATTANIRSLTALFTAIMLFALIGFRRAGPLRDRYLLLFALALGLGITHHASLIFMSVIFVIFLLLSDPILLRTPRRWLTPLLALLIGLLPLLYLPWRANAAVRGTTPGLATINGFINHVLALGFRGDLFYYTQPAELWERSKVMLNVLTFQFAPLLLMAALLGLLLLIWRDRHLAFLLGGSFAIHTFITATYRAPQTVEYMLPAYLPLMILVGVFAGFLVNMVPTIPKESVFVRNTGFVLAALLLTTAVTQTQQHYASYQQHHIDTTARDYAQPLLETAPPNAAILAHWHWVTPLWYLQEVEGLRPDVSVRFVFPEGEPYAETWARRVKEEWSNGRNVISTHYDSTTYHDLPQPEPYFDAFLFRQLPRLTPPKNTTTVDITLGQQLQIEGYIVEETAVATGEETIITLIWQPIAESTAPTTLFAHLVGTEGQIVAQQDVPTEPQQTGLTLTQLRLTTRPGTQPGDYSLLIGAYNNQPLLNSKGEPRTNIAPLMVTAAPQPPTTKQPTYQPQITPQHQILIGTDWDNTLPSRNRLYLHWQTADGYITTTQDDIATFELPSWRGPWGFTIKGTQIRNNQSQQYVPFGQGITWHGELINALPDAKPGYSLTWPQLLNSDRPIFGDYALSVRLIGYEEDGFHWAWWDLYDSIPAMGAIPTLKWIAGSQVRSPHFVTVDENAPAGQTIGGALTIYDAFNNRPLPILDERISSEFAWVPLGQRPLP